MAELFAFGSNGSGQLGIGHTEDVSIPTQCIGLPEKDTVVKVVGGGNHSACLMQSGRVYMAGKSQCCHVDTDAAYWMQYNEPEILQGQHWKDVACGWAFTLVVDATGQVFAFGTGGFGEIGPGINEATSLVKLEGLRGIVAVACGWRHAVALDQHGAVFGWGWNRYGQLGSGDKVTAVHRLALSRPVKQIACGHLHTLLLDECGQVICLGSDKHGQLSSIPETRLVSISSGWHHSGGMDKNGNLIMWGRSDHNQVLNCKEVTHFVCGSEHTLAFRREDKVTLAWGWNEHGNCGSSTETYPAMIPSLAGSVVLLGAGCATSWIGIS